VVPDQPARDRLRRILDKEHLLPRHEHVVEPHLAVEFVEALRQRRDKRVRVAHRRLAAYRRDPLGGDRHDEAGAVAVDLHAVEAADIDRLGEGGARMHPDAAAQ
jgi:hypothetical protein